MFNLEVKSSMDKQMLLQSCHDNTFETEEDIGKSNSGRVESVFTGNEIIDDKENVGLPTMEVKVEKFCELLSDLVGKKISEESKINRPSNIGSISSRLRQRKAKLFYGDMPYGSSVVSMEHSGNLGFLDDPAGLQLNQPHTLSGEGETIVDINSDGSSASKVVPFCKTCNKFFVSMENLNKHNSSEYHTKKIHNVFPCCICNRTFLTAEVRRVHMRQHDEKDCFKCVDCRKQFMFEVDLRKHELYVHDKKSLVCCICSKVLLTSASLEEHEERCDTKVYPCSVCDKVFRHWNQLKRHEIAHSNDKPYECDICGHKSKCKDNLNHHKKTHYPEKTFPCARCKKKFANLSQLRMHSCVAVRKKKAVMPGVKLFMCALCGQGFDDKLILVEHLQIHGMKQSSSLGKGRVSHACALCGDILADKYKLKRHEKTVHSIKKPYKCSLCEEKFEFGFDMSRHKKEAHAEVHFFMCGICKKTFSKLQELENHHAIHFEKRPFKCTTCKKTFKRKHHLQTHQLQHGGERKFECGQCLKKFLNKCNLRVHMFTHSDVKPFTCSICNKGFVSKKDLEAHSYTHSDKKQFNCLQCGQGFSANRILQKHLLQH